MPQTATETTLKLRFLTLVVIIAELINERTTYSIDRTHILVAPIAICTSLIFLGTLFVGEIKGLHSSWFLNCYALVTSAVLQIVLAIVVFVKLKNLKILPHTAQVLNGLLPMFAVLLILYDLTLFMFTIRSQPTIPVVA